MVRALARPTTPPTSAALYVNVAGLTNVAVANGERLPVHPLRRRRPGPMVQTLAERCGLTTEHARQWMGHVGLATPLDDVEGDAELVAATRQVLEDGVHQMADTVRNSLNFYRMQENARASPGPSSRVP